MTNNKTVGKYDEISELSLALELGGVIENGDDYREPNSSCPFRRAQLLSSSNLSECESSAARFPVS